MSLLRVGLKFVDLNNNLLSVPRIFSQRNNYRGFWRILNNSIFVCSEEFFILFSNPKNILCLTQDADLISKYGEDNFFFDSIEILERFIQIQFPSKYFLILDQNFNEDDLDILCVLQEDSSDTLIGDNIFSTKLLFHSQGSKTLDGLSLSVYLNSERGSVSSNLFFDNIFYSSFF